MKTSLSTETCTTSVRSNSHSECGDSGQSQVIATQSEVTQQPNVTQAPTSLRAAFIRMLPPDYPSAVGLITTLVGVIVACIDFFQTHDAGRFLLLSGLGSGLGAAANQATAKYLPTKGEKSPYKSDEGEQRS